MGPKGIKQPKASKSRYGQKRDERPLGQTVDYEGGLENSASKHNASGMLRSSGDDLERPIYDSKEDPIPKLKNKGQARGSGNVFVSGESFGRQAPSRASAHDKAKNARGAANRDRIDEDFLNEEDDIEESGELNSDMFR